LRERDHLGDTGIDGRIILNGSSGSVMKTGVDWIDMVRNRDSWWLFVNTVINFLIIYNVWNFLAS
jgi:hypothetical protein